MLKNHEEPPRGDGRDSNALEDETNAVSQPSQKSNMNRKYLPLCLLSFLLLGVANLEAEINYRKTTNLYNLKVRGWFGFVDRNEDTDEKIGVDHKLLSSLGDSLVFRESGYGTVFRPFFGDSRLIQAGAEEGRNKLFVSSDALNNQKSDCSLRLACLVASVQAFEMSDDFSENSERYLSSEISEEKYFIFIYNSLCVKLEEFRKDVWSPFLKRKGIKVNKEGVFENLPNSKDDVKAWLKSETGKLVGIHARLPIEDILDKS